MKTDVPPSESFIVNPVVESVSFCAVIAPPSAIVRLVTPPVSNVSDCASLVPSAAVAPKLLPPSRKKPEPDLSR